MPAAGRISSTSRRRIAATLIEDAVVLRRPSEAAGAAYDVAPQPGALMIAQDQQLTRAQYGRYLDRIAEKHDFADASVHDDMAGGRIDHDPVRPDHDADVAVATGREDRRPGRERYSPRRPPSA